MTPETLARFWAKVSKSDNCWEWTAALHDSGYGIFGTGDKRVDRAHRISWRLVNGDIPAGLFVCHHCDNRKCIRPDHLFLGTNDDNRADMVRKGRQSTPPPMGGHNRIDPPASIVARLGKEPDTALAREMGVSKAVIQRARRSAGIAPWADVNGNPTRFRAGEPHPRWSPKELAECRQSR